MRLRALARLHVVWLLSLCIAGCLAIAEARMEAATSTVMLDHRDGSVTPFQTLELSKGDSVSVTVVHTDTTCFSYPISAQVADTGRSGDEDTSTKKLSITHDGKASSYQVTVSKRAGVTDACGGLPDRTWTLPVFTHGWTLGFAGGFTVDSLIDRSYVLEAGTQNGVQGYFVGRNKGAEDSAVLGVAALVHLYHTDWAVSNRDIGFVPISFGLGIGATAETRYFFGTGLRFSDQVFLTFGGVFGAAKRSPSGLPEGAFTTNANALATLGSEKGAGGFVALSYAFLGSGAKARLQTPFTSTSPATPPAAQPATPPAQPATPPAQPATPPAQPAAPPAQPAAPPAQPAAPPAQPAAPPAAQPTSAGSRAPQ
jgi:hypothetical protein